MTKIVKKHNKIKVNGKTIICRITIFMFTLALIVSYYPQKAHAICVGCPCTNDADNYTEQEHIIPQHDETEEHIIAEFDEWEDWLLNEAFMLYILPGLMMLTHQISNVAMWQMFILGTLFDAKNQLETQQVFRVLAAEAHHNYHPSVEVCEVATQMRSLAATERYTKYNAYAMSQRAQDRHLGQTYAAGSPGEHMDKLNRLEQFKKYYCDIRDINFNMSYFCAKQTPPAPVAFPGGITQPPAAAEVARVNIDINYNRLVDFPHTLDVDYCDRILASAAFPYDFTCDPILTDTEEDLFSLADNLYEHDILSRIHESEFLNTRSIAAKRSVAENSFNVIAGLKSLGSPNYTAAGGPLLDEYGVETTYSEETATYMQVILLQLGLAPGPDMDEFLLSTRPSYYAQMEILTKKMFQRPEFYTGLYDTEANIKRKSITLQAIDLMQDLDTFKSHLRTEMMLSILLELEVMEYQEMVENTIGLQRGSGDR